MKTYHCYFLKYLSKKSIFLILLFSIASPLLAQNWGRLADPDLRSARVAALKNESEKKRAEAWQLARVQGWKPRWKIGNTVYELLAIEGNRVFVYKTFNSNSRISIAADLIESVSPYDLSGIGITVGVWDGGHIRTTHQELLGRVNTLESSSVVSHATHVGGTIAASGVKSSSRGMAPAAVLDSYHFDSDDSEMTGRAMSYSGEPGKIAISNHSYGLVCGWDNSVSPPRWYGEWGYRESDYFGKYHSDTRVWDSLCYSAPYYLPVKAAGNDRNNKAPNEGETFEYYKRPRWVTKSYDSSTDPYDDGWDNGGYDTIVPVSCAKNILTVGSVTDAVYSGYRDISRASMTSFSAWGPTDDGRIKPDLVTNGYSVYSSTAGSDSSYAYYSGTSTSTPAASGVAALLTEHHKNLFAGQYMLSSALKAVMIHSADDLGNPGPDYKFGWGLLNAQVAADIISDQAEFSDRPILIDSDLLSTESDHVYTIRSSGDTPIKATLCWTDPPGSTQQNLDDRTPRLVNDLDLRVYGPDGTLYQPYVLDVFNPKNHAATGDNTTDNVEQVYIPDPASAGEYTVAISYKGNLANNHQVYSLVITGQQLTPAGVDDLSVTTGPNCGQVELTWTKVDDANGYIIYYQEDSDQLPFMPQNNGIPSSGADINDIDSLIISDLDPARLYYFAVQGYNTKGVGDWSNTVSAKPEVNCTVNISGTVSTVSGYGIPDVAVTPVGLQDSAVTDANGIYTISVPLGWTDGMVQVDKTDWWFEPAERFYSDSLQNDINHQDYLGCRWADFDSNGTIDFADFAVLASWWLSENCQLNEACQNSDLDLSGTVNQMDLQLLISQWLTAR